MAGGWYGEYLSHSEIYNTETRLWRDGPPLPRPIGYMSSVQYEDTFILVGGYDDIDWLDTIYQYDRNLETWILRPERLSTPKEQLAAVLAGSPAADCS